MNDNTFPGRWTLTIETPLSGKAVNIRFASESAALAYKAELEGKNDDNGLNELIFEFEDARPTYTVWFDPAANPSVNIPSIPSGSSLRSVLDSPEAYDPNDY